MKAEPQKRRPIGGLAIPLDRFDIVLGNAPAVVVHDADVELGPSMTLLGKRSYLSEGGGVITTLIGCRGIIKIRPRRPSAEHTREDNGEYGGYAAHG